MLIEHVLERFPKRINLSEGTSIILRHLIPEDYSKLLKFFQEEVLEEDIAFLKDDVRSPETIREWCNNIKPERVFALVALHKDSIIGNASLHMRDFGWAKYVGKVRITTSYRWRGKGLGKHMLTTLEEVARDLMLEKLWAEIVVGIQEAAIKAFQRLGYREVGRLKRIVTDPQGVQHDLSIFIKDIGS